MAVTEREVLDALAAVRDPDKGGDIVALGMVSGVVVRDGNVGFAIEVEAERGPRLEPLRKAAEQAVEALPGVLSVTAVLTAEARPPGGRPQAPPRAPATRRLRTRPTGRNPPPRPRPRWRRACGRSSRSPPARAASANRRSPPTSHWR